MVESSYVIVGFHQLVSHSVRDHVTFRLPPCTFILFPHFYPLPNTPTPLPHFSPPSL